ncbi:MAG: pentapeptide repeat-containing protein, partial [Deltaproteobacteria bacterium]|nr:pentapeptide repeat-containing protein [Deltaproteobacteria bacterium]
MVNGFTTWLLDGLDELYAGDPGFFDYLLDLVTRPRSKAQITIFCRDSVLSTSSEFSDFCDYGSGSTTIRTYRLSEWEHPSKRQFAWLRLEGRLSKPGEQDTGRVSTFLAAVDGSETARALSGLPFYCDLLLQQHEIGALPEFADDIALLNHVIDQMVDREIKKGLLDLRFFEPNGLSEWLEQIALDYVEAQRYADIDRDQAMEYGRFVLRDGLDDKTKHHLLTSLIQFPLFRAGTETGRIAFTHALIAEVLAARVLSRLLVRNPREVVRRLAWVDLEEPTLVRFIASKFEREAEDALVQAIRGGGLQRKSFTVALSLLLLARPERDLVKRIGVGFEGQDLVSVHFKQRDLSGMSFRCSDLSHAVFTDCDLRGALFEGAFMNRTRFDDKSDLRDAHFGDR